VYDPTSTADGSPAIFTESLLAQDPHKITVRGAGMQK
jgi:hypothetical protein